MHSSFFQTIRPLFSPPGVQCTASAFRQILGRIVASKSRHYTVCRGRVTPIYGVVRAGSGLLRYVAAVAATEHRTVITICHYHYLRRHCCYKAKKNCHRSAPAANTIRENTLDIRDVASETHAFGTRYENAILLPVTGVNIYKGDVRVCVCKFSSPANLVLSQNTLDFSRSLSAAYIYLVFFYYDSLDERQYYVVYDQRTIGFLFFFFF